MNAKAYGPVLAENLEELAETATEIGAEGVWILRGAQAAALAFSFTDSEETEPCTERSRSNSLVLEQPHETIVLIRFPASDGGEPGIESR